VSGDNKQVSGVSNSMEGGNKQVISIACDSMSSD